MVVSKPSQSILPLGGHNRSWSNHEITVPLRTNIKDAADSLYLLWTLCASNPIKFRMSYLDDIETRGVLSPRVHGGVGLA
jgi:hypothetical protein